MSFAFKAKGRDARPRAHAGEFWAGVPPRTNNLLKTTFATSKLIQEKVAYRGRPEDTARNEGIARMLKAGMSWSAVQAAAGCSRATIAKVAQRCHFIHNLINNL